MSLKGSALFPWQLHALKFGIPGVFYRLPYLRPVAGSSSVSTSGLSSQQEDGCGIIQKKEGPGSALMIPKEGPGSALCIVTDSEEERERRERRLWEKGLRKSVYETLRNDRITVDLFPELNFPFEGNYFPKLVPLVAQKIHHLLDKGADVEVVGELLDFLGISLNPHLVGEVVKLLTDLRVSLRFFEWAKCQPEYEHNAHAYSQLLCSLARKREKHEFLAAALDILEEMMTKGLVPSTVAVNKVIDRLCKANKLNVALKLMREVEANGVCFTVFTYNSVISALGKHGRFRELFKMLEKMESQSIQPNLLTYNSIIHSFGMAGEWQVACRVFDELPQKGITPDVITYNSLIAGLFKVGQTDEAIKVCGLMTLSGCEPDVVTYNSLIAGLVQATRLDDALKIFSFMKEKNCNPDVVTYNTLIGEFVFRNKFAEVSGVLAEMKKVGCLPTKTTRNLLLEIGLVDRIRALWGEELAAHLDCDCGEASLPSNHSDYFAFWLSGTGYSRGHSRCVLLPHSCWSLLSSFTSRQKALVGVTDETTVAEQITGI
ncbi:hypothetical protein R1sor_002958 [Riccia sorocarpa]|uniref:Pentatricopeptide repeat-containing protein n=1 Tax=Riccia sorocarpa TaxID=122646 RepID=A0ABD3H1X3_9MARC